MKKIVAVMAVVILVFAFAPFANAQITKDQYYARSTLSGNEIEFYEHVYSAGVTGEAMVYPDKYSVNSGRVSPIIQYVYNDSPELINWDGIYSDSEAQDLMAQIDVIADKVLSRADDMSEYEKVEYIYTWVTAAIEYGEGATERSKEEAQTIVGGFINREAVCSGIARTMQYLLYKIDVPAYVVVGDLAYAENHAWLLLKVEGQWYYSDPTAYLTSGHFEGYAMVLRDDSFLWGATVNNLNPPLPECPSLYELPPDPAPTPTPTPEPTKEVVEVNVPEPTENPAEGFAKRDNGILPLVIVAGLAIVIVVMAVRRKRK